VSIYLNTILITVSIISLNKLINLIIMQIIQKFKKDLIFI